MTRLNRVHVHRLVTRALGIGPHAPAGWVADEETASWWRVELDGTISPRPSLARPHFRGSIASNPCAGR